MSTFSGPIPFLVAAALVLLLFTRALRCHFRRTDPVDPWALRWLKVLFAGAALVDGAAVAMAPNIHGLAAWPLLVASLALFAWARRATRRERPSLAFSRDLPQFLLREGPYRYVRHPFYSSYLLFFAAFAAAVPSAITVLAWICVVVAYVRAARVEERKFAASSFASAYAEYANAVGAFLPRFVRL